jgi:FtsH-binding integral membrane protein
MRNLDDFREKVNEPQPDDRKATEVVFPDRYLGRVSLYLIVGLLIAVVTYFFHLYCPIILNVFYSDITHCVINDSPFVIACIVLPVIVPLIVSQSKRKTSFNYQLGFLILMGVILGSTFAFIFIPLGGSYIVMLLFVFIAAHGILSLLQYNVNDFSKGKYATGTLLLLVFLFFLICDLFGEVNYVGWIVSIVAMTVTTYVGYDTRVMKQALSTTEESEESIREKIIAESVHLLLRFVVLVYPHAFMTRGFTPTHVKRRWMGPEDGR